MTHTTPVPLAPGDAFLPRASTDRQHRRPRHRDVPQVSGTKTRENTPVLQPPALGRQRWGWGRCVCRSPQSPTRCRGDGRSRGRRNLGCACVSPGIALVGQELSALQEVRAGGAGVLRRPGCAEQWDLLTPESAASAGRFVILLIGKKFKGSQCQTALGVSLGCSPTGAFIRRDAVQGHISCSGSWGWDRLRSV